MDKLKKVFIGKFNDQEVSSIAFNQAYSIGKDDCKGVGKIDLDAAYYEQHSGPQLERAQELLKNLQFTESSSVLDVGCGHGHIIAEIAQTMTQGQCIGVDSSDDMIRWAQEKFTHDLLPHLKFAVVKAEEMEFDNCFFDFVLCFSCLLWVRKPKLALERMCKALKHGGELVVLTYLKESSYILFLEKALEEFTDYQAQSAAHTMLSIEEYKEELKAHGLEFIEFRPEWRFSKYKNKDELKSYLRGWVSCFVPLPVESQERFLDKAVEYSCMENVNKLNDEIMLPYQLLAIRAKKICI